jgi:hypothetical protein
MKQTSKFFSSLRMGALASACVASMFAAGTAGAANIAIFGNNNIATFYSGLAGNSVTVVSDSQLATAGFLSSYDVFVYTRDGYSFGTGLSVAAAANVKSFVQGNVVLLNGDFQDDIGTTSTDNLFKNVLSYVSSNPKGGYIGEYTGSFAAFSSNADGYSPIGLINGSAGVSGGGQGGSDGEVQITAYGVASPITSGVGFPYNPGAVEFGSTVTGINPAQILAVFDNGNAAIVAGQVQTLSVPEPETYGLVLAGLMVVGMVAARRKV